MAAREPRPLELPDNIRDSLIQLRKLSDVQRPATVAIEQVESLEEALKCTFPDTILALFANGDDGLVEDCGVRIEDVYDNTLRAREMGHPKDKIAIGSHPDSHCFWCVSKSPPNPNNPGITEYDNFDGGSSFYSLEEWLTQIYDDRADFLETTVVVSDEDRQSFLPALV